MCGWFRPAAARLAEATTILRVPAERRMQHLDRDRTVQAAVPTVTNFGHPTAAQNPRTIAAAKKFWRLHTPTLALPSARGTVGTADVPGQQPSGLMLLSRAESRHC